MENITIENLYDLKETIAADLIHRGRISLGGASQNPRFHSGTG